MLAGMFRFVCQNGLVCGDAIADVRVPTVYSLRIRSRQPPAVLQR